MNELVVTMACGVLGGTFWLALEMIGDVLIEIRYLILQYRNIAADG